MLICRYLDETIARWGIIEEGQVCVLEGDPFNPEVLANGTQRPRLIRGPVVGSVESVRLLAPVRPAKIIGIGRNYAAHAQELGNAVPDEPLMFFKPPNSVIGPGEAIELVPENRRVDHEAELAVVIGRRGRFIAPGEALDYVLGYSCGNDVTDRDFQKQDKQWVRAKGFDTFCPLGPWIHTDLDPSDVRVICRVNGIVRQESTTRNLIYDVPFLIAYISRVMTLEPGDVILTGTPEGVSPIQPGDVVEVEVEGVGTLRNPVIYRDMSER